MAAVLDPKTDPAARFETKVDEQIAEATSRIRAHDLTFGGLLVAALVLVYFTAMIVLDKYLVLPEWVRQLALGGFLLALGGAVWLTLVRPFRRQINPLYAAVQVERTVEDAKNSVAGYVDAKENDRVHPTVRAAMGARAAKSAAEADLNQAVDHRSLIYVGGAVVALVLVLVVLFFVFRPTQFRSLAGRTLAPFSSDAIATRTQLTLSKPAPPDQTITAGQSIDVAVYVAGKVPAADSPEKVRLMIRHNPADPNYEVVPMERGESSREWSVRVPDYLIQNGFWYKVAGGDAETPEHKISIRTAPLFVDFEADYAFPEYLRMKPITGVKGNRLIAFRGTKVTLTAKANRDVKDGRMDVEPTAERVPGKVHPNRADSLRFEYKLIESGTYRLHFTATNGERNSDPPPFAIQVLSDAPPSVTVLKPEEDEIPLPANGLLAVDATAGDDFGIDKVTLKLKLVGDAEKPLADKPYLDGKSFLRASDNTWPTVIDYKDSVDLGKLKDPNGLTADLKEGQVIEYWLEAADNCTEPKPNVGKSKVKRVRLTAPVKEPDPMQKDARKNEEKKHNADQNQRLDKEERKPPQDPQQPQQPQDNNPPKQDNPPKNDQGGKEGDPKKGDNPPPQKKDGEPGKQDGDPKKGEQGKTDTPPDGKGGMEPKGDNPMKGENPSKGDNPPTGGMGNTGMNEAPPPREPGQKPLDDQARQVQEEINNQKKNEGTGKPNNSENANDRTDPAQPKPQPMNAPKPEDAGPKPPPKPDPMNPQGGNAATSKPEGNVQPPPQPSDPKPNEPKKDPMGGEPQKPQPKGGQGGDDQPQPKAGGMNDPAPKKDDGGKGKPAGEQPKDPQGAGAPKPMNEPNRGGEQPPPPQAGAQPDKKDPDAGGDGKPQQPPQAGAPKPGPQEPMNPQGDPAQKPPPQGGMGDPAGAKPDNPPQPTPGMPEQKGVDRGGDQADPQANATPEKKGEPKNGGGGAGEKKLDPKEIGDAAKDLNSPDPAKREAAQKKLDNAMGKENREAAEKLANDLQSPDKATREAAEKKLDDMRKQAEKNGGKEQAGKDGKGEKVDPKEVEQNIRDLNSPDEKTRAAAKDKLDKQLGEKGRKDAEDIAKGMQSGDPNERGAAHRKFNDLKKDLDEKGKKGDERADGKKMTKEEMDEMAKKMNDLASKDDAKRKAAEKDLDDKIGEENRKKLQEIAQDMQSGDPKKQQDAKDRLGKLADEIKGPRGGSGEERARQRQLLDDAKKRLESSQLQLVDFEKNRDNKDLHEKLGWSQGDYDRFLKGVEQRVAEEAKEVAAAEQDLLKPLPPPGAATQNVSGANKVAGRKGDDGKAVVGGTVFAPPGFSDAARKYKEDAARLNSTPKK